MGTVAEIVAIVGVLGCAVLGRLAFRRVQLGRTGGVEVALRRRPADGATGWRLGIGRYSGDDFAWHGLPGLRTRPDVLLTRSELEITGRRMPSDAEDPLMPPSATVLSCQGGTSQVELAMSPDVLTGFLSWLQASPPGRTGYRQAS